MSSSGQVKKITKKAGAYNPDPPDPKIIVLDEAPPMENSSRLRSAMDKSSTKTSLPLLSAGPSSSSKRQRRGKGKTNPARPSPPAHRFSLVRRDSEELDCEVDNQEDLEAEAAANALEE